MMSQKVTEKRLGTWAYWMSEKAAMYELRTDNSHLFSVPLLLNAYSSRLSMPPLAQLLICLEARFHVNSTRKPFPTCYLAGVMLRRPELVSSLTPYPTPTLLPPYLHSKSRTQKSLEIHGKNQGRKKRRACGDLSLVSINKFFQHFCLIKFPKDNSFFPSNSFLLLTFKPYGSDSFILN